MLLCALLGENISRSISGYQPGIVDQVLLGAALICHNDVQTELCTLAQVGRSAQLGLRKLGRLEDQTSSYVLEEAVRRHQL